MTLAGTGPSGIARVFLSLQRENCLQIIQSRSERSHLSYDEMFYNFHDYFVPIFATKCAFTVTISALGARDREAVRTSQSEILEQINLYLFVCLFTAFEKACRKSFTLTTEL